jgi:mRNA interferase RelE/StbE
LIWQIEWVDQAVKEFKKIDRPAQRNIQKFLKERIETHQNPKRFGEPLRKTFVGFWKYRVGDYRVICQIQEQRVVVLVIRVGHRRSIYDI